MRASTARDPTLEVQPDTTNVQQASDAVAGVLPKQSKTRQGKARLLTIDDLDARTAVARGARALVAALSADLTGGNDTSLPAGKRQLVTRAAMTGAVCDDFEARWVAGEPIPLAEYLQAVNVQRRVLVTLGLERQARDVSELSLSAYSARADSAVPVVRARRRRRAVQPPSEEEGAEE
jgi:hypothetical protein